MGKVIWTILKVLAMGRKPTTLGLYHQIIEGSNIVLSLSNRLLTLEKPIQIWNYCLLIGKIWSGLSFRGYKILIA